MRHKGLLQRKKQAEEMLTSTAAKVHVHVRHVHVCYLKVTFFAGTNGIRAEVGS